MFTRHSHSWGISQHPSIRVYIIKTSSVSSCEFEFFVKLQDASILQENNDFSAERHRLEHVLSTMEKELVKTQTQLLEAKKEVACMCV